MNKLTEQQTCHVYDTITDLAKEADRQLRKLAEETGTDYDYVRNIYDQLLDADFSHEGVNHNG